MSPKCSLIKEHVENLLHYLQPFLPLANFHMVDYFSKDAYIKYIPEIIRQEIKEIGDEVITNYIFQDDYQKMPNLFKYVEKSREFTLKNSPIVCMNINVLQEKLIEWGSEEFLRLKLDIFMTSKKSHEVEILSFISAAIKNVANTSHIIDIGDGKGYLSSMLALHYKIPVLGIDASATNTNGAIKRVQKLSKIWNSVVNVDAKKSKETTANLYKQVTQFVHEDLNFNELVSNVFLEKPNGLSLVGLHTCGNLAASSIRIFNASEHIKTICNVGCCYHLITEHYDEDTNKQNSLLGNGFPMSNYLKEQKFAIGRSARMIAAQSVDRILDRKSLPNKTIFYRALFEVLVERKCENMPCSQRHVGRFRKECVDFLDYVRKATKRINLEIDISDGEIIALYNEYKNRENELNNFYLIRNLLSPIIESLILLDRLLFLHEQGYENK